MTAQEQQLLQSVTGFPLQVDAVIDICSDVMNLRTVIYNCKKKLEEIKDDYEIEVSSFTC